MDAPRASGSGSTHEAGVNAGLAGLGQLPIFELPAAGGGTLRSWSFRGRRALVLWLAGPEPERPALVAGAAIEPRVRQEGAELVTVIASSVERAEQVRRAAGLQGPVLADADGRLHARLGAAPSALLVTDRNGTIFWHTPLQGQPPPFDEALSWLEYLNILEPECGSCVPAWPPA